MVRAHAFAIGLSDYSQSVMLTRKIALPAVLKPFAHGPARLSRSKRRCGDRGASLARPSSENTLRELQRPTARVCDDRKENRTRRYGNLVQVGNRTSRDFTVSSSVDSNDLPDTIKAGKEGREADRLATLEHLRAVRTGVDHVLQELVDEVRGVFSTDLCMVNLNLTDVQYFRAWSGELDPDLAEARQDALEHSMCRYVVNAERPLVVEDFLATEELREQPWHVNYGIRFYAGTPLITSAGHVIGTLCLLNTRSVDFGEEQIKVLGAFARAVVGRLELLGALEREQAAKEEEAQRSQELQHTLDSLSAHIAILDESGEIIAVNGMWRAFAEANGSDPGTVSEGANYLRACESATGLYAEEAAAFAEGIRDVLAGRRANFEMEYPCHSPTEQRWFMGRVTPYFCDEKAWAVVAHENITERKLAEEALRDQKVLLETILGQAADAIIVCDDKGRFTFANAAARRMALQDPEGTTLDTNAQVWGRRTTPTDVACPRRNGLYPGPSRGNYARQGGTHDKARRQPPRRAYQCRPSEQRRRGSRRRGRRLAGYYRAQTGRGGAGSIEPTRDRGPRPERGAPQDSAGFARRRPTGPLGSPPIVAANLPAIKECGAVVGSRGGARSPRASELGPAQRHIRPQAGEGELVR